MSEVSRPTGDRGHDGGVAEPAGVAQLVVEMVREAPPKTKWVLALNAVAGLAAIAIAFWDVSEGLSAATIGHRVGVIFGLLGIFLLTLAQVLHHVSQGDAAACSRWSFFQLRYRQLHRVFVALPVLGIVAGLNLALAVGLYAGPAIREPILLIVLALFAAYLAFAVRTVALTSRFLYRHAREQAEAAARARAEAVEAQLSALQARLNPHFLFNALNTVASLVRTDARAAEAAVENLAEVLRRTLDRSGRSWTTLREELDHLKAYLAIEQERWGDRLGVEWAVAPEALDARVPPMTLQPLVENALRHGIGPRLEGGRVRISAARENGRLTLTVGDDGVGFPARYRERTGLGVLRERIQTLYGEAADLRVDSEGRGARVAVELPAEDGIPPEPERVA